MEQHPHASLIDELGGAPAVAKALNIAPNVAGNWRLRGKISWQFRPAVARLAEERGVTLPEGFLEPEATKGAA